MKRMNYNFILFFSLFVTFFSIFIVLSMAVNPPINIDIFFWRRPLVGVIFSIMCILGASASFMPFHCSNLFFSSRKTEVSLFSFKFSFSSHHPDCDKFINHVISIRNNSICAACTGLFIGAIVTIFGNIFYFFGNYNLKEYSLSIIFFGVASFTLGLFQLKFKKFARLIFNVFFVFGSFLILIGIDSLIQSLLIDTILIIMIFFWILTRIQLSQWDHSRVCKKCEFQCEYKNKMINS